MKTVRETAEFKRWLKGLRDVKGRRHILRRIARIASMGQFGDVASVGGGVSEIRVHVGPGYRGYYTPRGEEVVILLCGGDKDNQARDIKRAKELVEQLE